MSVTKVKEYLKEYGRENDVMEFPVSSATVELAAAALHTQPARIAKTMSFHEKEEGKCILVVTAGDVKIDNSKFKQRFGYKAKMLGAGEVADLTGHEVGGVCPFANPPQVTTYLDVSLRRFDMVYPAAGSASSAIAFTCEDLFTCSRAADWVDVCKPKDEAPAV